MATTSTSPPPPPPPQDHPSPTPTPTNPSSPKPLKKKTQPLPWSYPETTNLIQAYQDKWYSLKKGQLKASQWEEVSVTVAVLCGGDPSKSATQCRHKIEKLRKRYRAEKQKPNPNYWPYFDLMDCMERGPLPISARPMSVIQYQKSNSTDNDDDYDDDDEKDEDGFQYYDDPKKHKAKSINHIVRNHVNVNKSNFNVDRKFNTTRVLQTPMLRKRKEFFERDDDEEEEEEEDDDDDDEEDGGVAELAAEIRAFAERFVRMEHKKIEMMRETQRFRMEMENKRMEMILDSQRKIVDTIGRTFGSHKKLKMAQESS